MKMISDPKSEIEKNLIRVSPILYLRSSTKAFWIHEITLESRFWPENVPIGMNSVILKGFSWQFNYIKSYKNFKSWN